MLEIVVLVIVMVAMVDSIVVVIAAMIVKAAGHKNRAHKEGRDGKSAQQRDGLVIRRVHGCVLFRHRIDGICISQHCSRRKPDRQKPGREAGNSGSPPYDPKDDFMEEVLQELTSRNGFVAGSVILLPLLLAAGCQPRPQPLPAINYAEPLPEGQVALRKIATAQYPDFSKALAAANLDDLRASARNSLDWLNRPSSKNKYPYLDIDHDRAVASVRAFIQFIDSGAFTLPPDAFNRRIAEEFEVYQSIGAPSPDGRGSTNQVLFTGYFTPTYDASPTRGGAFQWPLFKRPKDLVGTSGSDSASRRSAEGSLVPYYTRQEIESGALAGDELVWLTSRWNAYVITIQGSARLRMPDGHIMEVGYAGFNGYPYASPGKQMIADGLIPEKEISLETMRRYFDAHPEAMDKYLWRNPRTVFFTEVHGGPFGSLNVPVTRLASIATDKDVYPPAMVAFLSVPIPAMDDAFPGQPASLRQREFSGFLLDQDRGGAIRSAGRCDIYMGIGARAEQTAGHQLNAGQLYYLAAKR
jgi:membrane-bound lytic murein transglycosylase A